MRGTGPARFPCASSTAISDKVYADVHGWSHTPPGQPASSDTQIAKSGMVLICLADETNWVDAAAQAARDPASPRIDVEIARSFLDIPDSRSTM